MPPEIITMASGEIGYVFVCKRSAFFPPSFITTLSCADVALTQPLTSNPSKFISRARSDDSTSNLTRHAKSCGIAPSTALTPESNFDLGRFRYLVAAWSARRARPFAIIEDEDLRDILIMLRSTIEIHSRQTVARDISDMYMRSRNVIALHLQSVKHRLHIGLDGWTSPNVISFLGVTVQYFDKGDICAFVLDFVKYGTFLIHVQSFNLISMCRMTERHTGEHLARRLEELLKSFGIEHKVRFFWFYRST
jgi:hypothetical protein